MIELLNFNNDILEIIKKELDKLDEREKYKLENFKYMDDGLQLLYQDFKKRDKIFKMELMEMIYDRLYKSCITKEEIKEYVTNRNLIKYLPKNYRFLK